MAKELKQQYLLLGGATDQYKRLYQGALQTMKQHIFYRSMTANGADIRFPGQINVEESVPISDLKTEPEAQHLGCFAGGMVGVGAKIFEESEDLILARQLVEGCLWAYEVSPLGIMPEIMHTVLCANGDCPWDESKYHVAVDQSYSEEQDGAEAKISRHGLGPGVAKVDDARYILRYVDLLVGRCWD